MVFHKRLDYGSSGYRVPRFLQVPSSARRKRSPRRKLEDKQMCAFDLLATVAGELLLERDSTLLQCEVPAVAKGFPKKENVEYEKPIKVEVFDQGSCNESSKLCSPKIVGKDATEPMVAFRMGESTPKKSYPGQMASCKSEVGMKTPLQDEQRISCNGNGLQISNDPMDLDSKPPALVSSDSSAEFPISRTTSFPNYGKEISVDRDDDENNSMCTNRRISTSKGFRPQRIGDNRIKKMLASKYWKVAPKDGELSNAEMKGSYRNRKLCYTRQRTQKCSSRRRKFLDRRSMSASYLDMFDESVSPKLAGIKMEPSNASLASLNTAKGASSSTSGQADYHVKLCIKSFKVPELFIEIPENATVGSLKRTVMEAVTAILGGGLRIGVLHEGKKVRDDNKTLLQAGISHNDRMDNLGFTLEPSSSPILPSLLCAEDPNSVTTSNITEQLKMIPAQPPSLELAVASEVTPQAPQRSDYDSVYSPADTCSIDKMADSKALVPVPSMNVRPLNAVPLPKSRRMELVQRRIRRPFSVSEVEALVQAVEKLGTGRWRDVKIRSFDNAKHRTYVDLKDKWKTLVHTAEISPQQRRGEPVPQELLDRVLSAHAYWSTHQAKSPAAEACLLA